MSDKKYNELTYKQAGVDIKAGNNLIDAIKPLAAMTKRLGADGALGGFGALFDPKAAGYKDPLMVAATDGVGTKLKIAIDTDIHDTVGIDLVAMCVNDLLVQGAEPLVFLDYFATGKLSVENGKDLIKGIANGCKLAGCALIGGETAEMPGLYADGDYDLAGFAIGAVERENLLDGTQIRSGDIVIGLPSSGVHSNGFSLVRKILEINKLNYQDPAPFAEGQTIGDALLEPTRIYVKQSLAALKVGGVRGLCHITGGGFYENLPRVYSHTLCCNLTYGTWPELPIFKWLKHAGHIDSQEMLRTFNCGIGMVLFVNPDRLEKVRKSLEQTGETVYKLGMITDRLDGPSLFIDGID